MFCNGTRYATAVINLFKLQCFSLPTNLCDPNDMTAILFYSMLREENIARQRALLDNKNLAELHQTTPQTNARIQSVISFSTSWLLAATSGLAWVNMPKPLKIRSTIILILPVLPSLKLSLPMILSYMRRGSVSLRNWSKIPFNKPVLSRLPGGYKRTARTAKRLPLQQRVIDLKYTPFAAQCNWYYAPGGCVVPTEITYMDTEGE